MNRRSRIITFVIAAGISYGCLFAFVGPEKARAWHQQRNHHHEYYHDHHCTPDRADNLEAQQQKE